MCKASRGRTQGVQKADTGRLGTDVFSDVRGDVYESLLMFLDKNQMKMEYAVIRWYNDCEALVLFTGL